MFSSIAGIMPMMSGGIFAVFILLMLAIYLLPTLVAVIRDHHASAGVFLINLFLGWTLLGWLGSLIWAAIGPNNSVQNYKMPPRNNMVDELERLAKLREAGHLSEEEFEQKKRELF